MPGNTVRINNSDDHEWYVGDSKMDELVAWLDEHGVRQEPSFCLRDPNGSILIRFKNFDESEKWFTDRANDDNDPIHGIGKVRIDVGIGDTGNSILYDVDPHTGVRARELLRLAEKDLRKIGMDCTRKPLEENPVYPVVLDQGIVEEILEERGETSTFKEALERTMSKEVGEHLDKPVPESMKNLVAGGSLSADYALHGLQAAVDEIATVACKLDPDKDYHISFEREGSLLHMKIEEKPGGNLPGGGGQ